MRGSHHAGWAYQRQSPTREATHLYIYSCLASILWPIKLCHLHRRQDGRSLTRGLSDVHFLSVRCLSFNPKILLHFPNYRHPDPALDSHIPRQTSYSSVFLHSSWS